MSSRKKTFGFALSMCVVCGLLLTFAADSLRPIQEFNQQVDQQKNILKVARLIDIDKKYSAQEIDDLYKQSIQMQYMDQEGQLHDDSKEGRYILYLHIKNRRVESYIMPISGYGLWSTLYGYFAVEGDGKTVKGITFYAHGETPGLGAECEADWFQSNFVGKKIVDESGRFVSIGIAKGKAANSVPQNKRAYYVDGISGATVTSRGIDVFLRKDLKKYEPFSKRLRRGKKVI